jgi:hypothetical protein
MRLTIFIAAAALSLAAGCERGNETAPPTSDRSSSPTAPAASPDRSPGTASPSGGATTSTTPAEVGQSGSAKTGTANPVQQQVDPKEAEQHRDFQQKGDAAGPTNPDSPQTKSK